MLPDIGVPVLCGRYDAVGVRSPIDTSDQLVVLRYRQTSVRDPSVSLVTAHLGKGLGRLPIVALTAEYLDIVRVQAHRDLLRYLVSTSKDRR